MTFQELENTIDQHMLLKDRHIVRLLCAFMVAVQLPINPPWLFIVGAPSSGKSKLLKALQGVKNVFPIDELTPSTFASGMRGKDGQSNSLLDNLPRVGATLLFKDFTTIISKEDEARGQVIGQMRKIYDGDFVKKTGSGTGVNWEGRLAVLAGVTETIYPAMYKMADMGERFLMYELDELNKKERKAVGHMAADNLDDGPGDLAIKAAFTEYINNLNISQVVAEIDRETKDQIVDLAEFITRARTPVQRDKYGRSKPITQIYQPESTPRFVKQVLGLSLGLQALNAADGNPPDLTDNDRKLLQKMALNCIPSTRRLCLRALTKYGGGVESRGLAMELGYDTDSIKIHLYDLAALKVIERHGDHRDRWFLKDDYRKLMSRYEGIVMEDGILAGVDDDESEFMGLPVEEPPAPGDLLQSAMDVFLGSKPA